MSYLPHLAKGAMVNFSGAIVRMILVYLYTLTITRILDVYEVGQIFLMVTIVNILGTAAVVGLDYGLVRYVALFAGEGKNRQVRKVIKVGVLIGVLFALIVTTLLFSLSGLIADGFFSSSETATTGLRIFAIAIPFWVLARLFNATTQGLHVMRYQVYSRDFGEQISKILITMAVVVMGAGFLGVVFANVASLVVAAFMALFFTRLVLPKSKMDTSYSPGWVKDLLTYSFPLAFSNVLVMVLLWIDLLLVGFLGDSTDAGYYGAALRVAALGAVIIVAFATVFNPIISDLSNKRKKKELEGLYKTVTRWIITCSLPFFLVIALFSEPIMKIFGENYTNGAIALTLLAVGHLITATIGSAGLIVLMTGRSHLELVNMIVALLVNITLCFLLIPAYGIIGAAIANMSAAFVLNIMRAAEVWFLMRMHAYDRDCIKPVLVGLVSSLIVVLAGWLFIGDMQFLQAVGLIVALLAIYVLGLLLFGLSEQDKAVLDLVKTRLSRAT